MSGGIDTNIKNYTIPELLTILNIEQEDFDEETVTAQTNMYSSQFANDYNRDMSDFFLNMQEYLLKYLEDQAPPPPEDLQQQTDTWLSNPVLPQKNPQQRNKITDRSSNQIDVYENTHAVANKRQLGVSNTYSVPIAQDKLNPKLENTTTRFINLDSKYRQNSGGLNLSTDYTLDLTETLTNVLSLRLYSFQIPYSWYSFDTAIGNTCFWVDGIPVQIISGNYSPTVLVSYLITALQTAGFTFPQTQVPVSYSSVNGLITLNLFGGTNTTTGQTITAQSILTFWDSTGVLSCKFNSCANIGITKYNNSFGYLLGFRDFTVTVNPTGNVANAILDLYGPKYLILAIDDFNQNRINNGLVGITEYSKVLKIPSYYNHSLPYVCNEPNSSTALTSAGLTSNQGVTYVPVQAVIPDAPRTLTQPQIYAINEIMKNNSSQNNFNLKSPTTTDTFAIIPFKKSGMSIGDVYVEMSGSLQDNKRVYFGPVTIDRFRITLYDDKGNILNLNGLDWSITLISENLYQY
jgi:hypothetical protein